MSYKLLGCETVHHLAAQPRSPATKRNLHAGRLTVLEMVALNNWLRRMGFRYRVDFNFSDIDDQLFLPGMEPIPGTLPIAC